MLVLTRKLHEQIRVGDNITVTVVRIGPNAVRLGITAPPSMNIARTELIHGGRDGDSHAVGVAGTVEHHRDAFEHPAGAG